MLYYAYLFVISDFMKRGMVHNTPNLAISALRTNYHVTIKTFQKNNRLNGFVWFKTIYLNENLLNKRSKVHKDPNYTLKWTFHHEHYHLIHNHKQKVLISRFLFSLIPLLASIPIKISFDHVEPIQGSIVVLVLGVCAYLLDRMRRNQEQDANEYANQKMKQ